MSAEVVTVFEIPKDPETGRINCRQCDATEKQFDRLGVAYELKDATLPENNSFIKGLGYMQAPVVTVTVDGEVVDHWSGFDPDRCKDLAYKLK